MQTGLLEIIENTIKPHTPFSRENGKYAQDVFDQLIHFYEQRLLNEKDEIKAEFYRDMCLQLKADEKL